MPEPRDIQRASTRVLSALMIVVGVVALATTLARGGGPFAVGVIFGVLFIAAGAARLHLERGGR